MCGSDQFASGISSRPIPINQLGNDIPITTAAAIQIVKASCFRTPWPIDAARERQRKQAAKVGPIQVVLPGTHENSASPANIPHSISRPLQIGRWLLVGGSDGRASFTGKVVPACSESHQDFRRVIFVAEVARLSAAKERVSACRKSGDFRYEAYLTQSMP